MALRDHYIIPSTPAEPTNEMVNAALEEAWKNPRTRIGKTTMYEAVKAALAVARGEPAGVPLPAPADDLDDLELTLEAWGNAPSKDETGLVQMLLLRSLAAIKALRARGVPLPAVPSFYCWRNRETGKVIDGASHYESAERADFERQRLAFPDSFEVVGMVAVGVTDPGHQVNPPAGTDDKN